MRRSLLTLLILLTVLRGLVGDAMAYGMTGQMMNAHVAINSIALNAYSMPDSEHFEHQKAAAIPCHDAADIDDTAEQACSTCQVCHLSVSIPLSLAAQLGALPQASAPSLQARSWASADLKQLSKPPLS